MEVIVIWVDEFSQATRALQQLGRIDGMVVVNVTEPLTVETTMKFPIDNALIEERRDYPEGKNWGFQKVFGKQYLPKRKRRPI